jgi:hypothetical protein
MSAIPVFEIGVWNAWIFMPYLFLIMLAAGKLKKGEEPKNELDNLGKTEKSIFIFSKLVFFCAVIYSIFLPLELGTIWLLLPHMMSPLPKDFIVIPDILCISLPLYFS